MKIKLRRYTKGPGVLLVQTGRGEVQAQVGDFILEFPSGKLVLSPDDHEAITGSMEFEEEPEQADDEGAPSPGAQGEPPFPTPPPKPLAAKEATPTQTPTGGHVYTTPAGNKVVEVPSKEDPRARR